MVVLETSCMRLVGNKWCRTKKRVILGHHKILQKGLILPQHHEGHTVTCVYIHYSR